MIQLVRSAQVITPNLTEALLLLYGKEEMEKRYAGLLELDGEKRLEQIGKIGEKLANQYCLQAAVITGIEYAKEQKAAPALISDGNVKNSMQMGKDVYKRQEEDYHEKKNTQDLACSRSQRKRKNTSHLWSAAGTGKQRDKDSLL